MAPHCFGLQPRKGCFKPPERLEQRVSTRARFAAHARCVVTGAVVEPHPRDRAEWKAARREQRIRAAGDSRAAAAAEASAGDSSLCDRPLAKAKKQPLDDAAAVEIADLKRRLQQAKDNMAYLLADCRYQSPATRHHHPCTWVKEWSP